MWITGSPLIPESDVPWLLILVAVVILWGIAHILENRLKYRAPTRADFVPDPTIQVSYRRETLDGDEFIVTKYQDGHEIWVCDQCGGNCGQCGITGKMDRLNAPYPTPPVMLDAIIRTSIPRKTMGDI